MFLLDPGIPGVQFMGRSLSNSKRFVRLREGFNKNIARGTTDPEIDFVTNFGNHMAPLALAANVTTR